MRLLRTLGLVVGVLYVGALAYLTSIWTYVSPYAAWAYVEKMIDLGESRDAAFVRAVDAIRQFHPTIALVAEGMVAEKGPQRDRSGTNLRAAEAKYRAASTIRGHAQAAALMRLALLYSKHDDLGASQATVINLLGRAYALDYPRAGFELGRINELGEGIKADLGRATQYYFAVFQGVAEAGIRLSSLYRQGRIEPPSTRFAADLEQRALDLFTKRVEQTQGPKSMLALAKLYQSDLVANPDFGKARYWLERAAAAGSEQAAYALGIFYQRPDTGHQDLPLARQILEQLAEKGNLSAIVKAARMRREGIGGPIDVAGAVQLYQTAVKRGSPPAMLKYGEALRLGDGTGRNPKAGMELVAKSATAGDANAALELARSFELGVDVSQDPEAALEWYETAGNRGSKAAMIRLAKAYRDGSLVDADRDKYLKWGLKAIEAGATTRGLQSEIGAALLSGEGLEADRARGFDLLLKAARQGDGAASLSVARGYAFGIGVNQNATSAIEWYQRAASAGRVAAYWELGRAYASGFGVPMNADAAYEYFTKAASAGYPAAMLDLGRMYVTGYGAARDAGRAATWFEKAAEAGNANAMIELANLHRERLIAGASDAEALRWLERGSAAGSGRAKYVLAVAFIEGALVKPDRQRAELLLQEAVNLQHAPAKARLLQLRQNGEQL